MSEDGDRRTIAGWAQAALRPEVANSVRADLAGDADAVAREHGGIRLTNVGHQFLACWLDARGDRAMPRAEDIRPARFRRLAPYVRYLQWEGEALVHRLWGSALTEAIGIDLTGTDMFSFVPEAARARDRETFRRLHAQPCGMVALVRRADVADATVATEMTFLPVEGAPGSQPRIIGTMQWRAPRNPHMDFGDRPEHVPPVVAEGLAFIDVGAGTPDAALLARQ